jgi:hypothetical protein
VSENRTTDAARDPAFAAVARVLDAEKAFTAAVAVKDYSRDVGLDEACRLAGLPCASGDELVSLGFRVGALGRRGQGYPR